MRNFLRLVHGVSISPLLLALARRPELWTHSHSLLGGQTGPYRDSDSIVLRYPTRAAIEQPDTNAFYDRYESIDYPEYAALPEARQLVMNVFTAVAGERLGSAILHRIPPGCTLYAHAEAPDLAAYYSRFHVVLDAGLGSVLTCGDEFDSPGAGTLFWFDHSLEHELTNNTQTDYLYLSVDARCTR